VALKELEPYIRSGEHLQTGKPFKQFGDLRSRELLANWLLCAAFNFDCGSSDRLTFTSDPLDGDGILYDTGSEASFPTEHVLVPAARSGEPVDIGAQIFKAINDKREEGGLAYASGSRPRLVLVRFAPIATVSHQTVIRRYGPRAHMLRSYRLRIGINSWAD